MNNVQIGVSPELNVINLKLGIDLYNNAEDVVLAAYNVPTETEPEKVERTLHAHTNGFGVQHAIMTNEDSEKIPFEFFFLPAEKAIMYGLYTTEDSTKLNLYINGEQAITHGTELFEATKPGEKVDLLNVMTSVPEGHELEGTIFDREVIEKLAGYYSPSVGDVLFVTESQRLIDGELKSTDQGKRKVSYIDVNMVGIIKSVEAFSLADLSILEEPYVG